MSTRMSRTEQPAPVTSVLVANRGEIARRVFRSCRALGLATVAVYSPADAAAPHVREAAAAVPLPGDAPAEGYLRGDLMIAAARAAGADAVHPGYGFLSEDASFARAVTAAGLTWIGPPAEAIEAMAAKPRAKELLGSRPLDPARLTAAQLPVLVKAAAGGGGRGMRIVRELAALDGALAAARAEAESAFGDGEVFVEPYVEGGRHVEVQLLADNHGTVWTLGTRDCSLQRRHQKVIEEAPAPGLDEERRAALFAIAVRAARAVGYRGAGTVEFLLAPDGTAHFLEMNTRLQVEHPVTEAVYGVDLVAWQIRIAEGEALPAQPPEPRGHAVQARLYAEDPARDWRPGTGVLHRLRIPGAADVAGADDVPGGQDGRDLAYGADVPAAARPDGWLRLDSGVADGQRITAHYDPMLAKVICWAPTRDLAIRRLAGALERATVHGPVTNRPLLVRALRHPDFRAGRLDTAFFDRHRGLRTDPPDDAADPGRPARLAALACAVADAAARTGDRAAGVAARLGGWRSLSSQPHTAVYRPRPTGPHDPGAPHPPHDGGGDAEYEYRIGYRYTAGPPQPEPDAFPGVRVLAADPGRVVLECHGVQRTFTVTRYGDGPERYVDSPLGAHVLRAVDRLPVPRPRTEPGSLLAPMPGTVTRIADGVAVGAAVTAGQPLLWLEAMKMEHQVTAATAGVLGALHAKPGQQVELGATLAVITDPAVTTDPAGDGTTASGDGTAPDSPA
jgi:propionyl-CoA carboxylase alpha chain